MSFTNPLEQPSKVISQSLPPSFWWETIKEECPITLEPLSTLPYPPFELFSSDASDKVYYFDGLALASYIVSRGIFTNPLTREPLSKKDCRRLDIYCEHYSQNNVHDNNNKSKRSYSVSEAYALRELVHVKNDTTNSNNITTNGQSGELEARQRRADILRSEATVALTGLFVFGNNSTTTSYQRRRQQQHLQTSQTESNTNTNSASSTVPKFGFNLSQTMPLDTSTEEMEGLRIIDDDEAMVVATDQEAYKEVQDAFPRLQGADGDANNIDDVQCDERLLQSLRTVARHTEEETNIHEYWLEEGRQQLLQQSIKHRQDLLDKRKQQHELSKANREKQRIDDEETQLAKAEIERWRNEQWAKLQKIKDDNIKKLQQQKQEKEKQKATQEKEQREIVASEKLKQQKEQQQAAIDEKEQKELKRKAKAAAKRKKAKERQKAKKALEHEEQRKKDEEAKLQKKKDESQVKCSACTEGIVGYGYEKFGHKFCSPKCARAGPSKT